MAWQPSAFGLWFEHRIALTMEVGTMCATVTLPDIGYYVMLAWWLWLMEKYCCLALLVEVTYSV